MRKFISALACALWASAVGAQQNLGNLLDFATSGAIAPTDTSITLQTGACIWFRGNKNVSASSPIIATLTTALPVIGEVISCTACDEITSVISGCTRNVEPHDGLPTYGTGDSYADGAARIHSSWTAKMGQQATPQSGGKREILAISTETDDYQTLYVPRGADNVLIDNDTLVLREVSTATLSGVGPRLVGRRVGANMPVRFSWFTPSSAVPNFAMPDSWNVQAMCAYPGTSASTLSGYFDAALTSGTISQPATANTSRFTRRFRSLITSAGSANSSARVGGHYVIYPGSGYAGGTFYAYSWTLDTDNGTSRVHVGLATALNSSNDPSAHTNTVYVGADAADTNLSIYSNDGSGTATAHTACGASFPKAGGLYSTAISIAPDASTYYVVVRREDSSATDCTATITTNIPSAGQQLRWIVQANTGATASAVAISLNGACAYVPREVQGYAP